MPYIVFGPIGFVFLLILFFMTVRVANEYQRAVILRLGRLTGTRGPGLYFLIPFVEQQTVIDQRVVTTQLDGQDAITRDNVPVKVDAVVWYRVVDPARSVITVQNVSNAITQISLTSLLNVIGRHTLDELLKEKEKLALEMRVTIDGITEPWGVEVQLVEVKDVVIPGSMQRAMAQEAEALREKRARIIKAEAEMEAAQRLRDAAITMMESPAALELRRLQMLTEVGAEQNTTTVVMMPSEFVSMASAIASRTRKTEAKDE